MVVMRKDRLIDVMRKKALDAMKTKLLLELIVFYSSNILQLIVLVLLLLEA